MTCQNKYHPRGSVTKVSRIFPGTKKAHDWVVDQLADLFHTTHKDKTQQVARSRVQTLCCLPRECGGSGDFGVVPTHHT